MKPKLKLTSGLTFQGNLVTKVGSYFIDQTLTASRDIYQWDGNASQQLIVNPDSCQVEKIWVDTQGDCKVYKIDTSSDNKLYYQYQINGNIVELVATLQNKNLMVFKSTQRASSEIVGSWNPEITETITVYLVDKISNDILMEFETKGSNVQSLSTIVDKVTTANLTITNHDEELVTWQSLRL